MSKNIVVDTLSFCHQEGFYGFLLGIVQYIPTVLFFGSFFWFLVRKDHLFLYLILSLKYTWLLCIILKYLIFPYIIPSDENGIWGKNCSNFIPSFNGYLVYVFYKIFYPSIDLYNSNTNMTVDIGSIYPNIDITQTFLYLCYFYTFVILSKPKQIHWVVILTWFILPLIPLNSLLIKMDTVGSVIFSVALGSTCGILFYNLFFRVGLQYIKDRENGKRKISFFTKFILCHWPTTTTTTEDENNLEDEKYEEELFINQKNGGKNFLLMQPHFYINQLKTSHMYKQIIYKPS